MTRGLYVSDIDQTSHRPGPKFHVRSQELALQSGLEQHWGGEHSGFLLTPHESCLLKESATLFLVAPP